MPGRRRGVPDLSGGAARRRAPGLRSPALRAMPAALLRGTAGQRQEVQAAAMSAMSHASRVRHVNVWSGEWRVG